LASWKWSANDQVVLEETYWEENVAKVHQSVNNRSDSGKVRSVRRGNESNGQQVVSEHLPMILPPLFTVDHVDLVEPPTKLSEIIELRQARQ
jgi:hypothetical protein